MLKNFKKVRLAAAGCALTAALIGGIVAVPTIAAAAEPGIAQASVEGLQAIGTETVETAFGAVEITRYLPELRDARIQGVAMPETNAPGDEIALDLRTLVGEFQYDAQNGDLLTVPGSATRSGGPVVDTAGRTPFMAAIDWSQYTWQVEGLPNTGVVGHEVDSRGTLTLVPRADNTEFGATVTLVHIATGMRTAPVTIAGQAGSNGTAADWLYLDDRADGEGNAPMWKANERGFAEGKFLSWSIPEETTVASPATQFNSPRPWMDVAISGLTNAPVSVPAGFGLERWPDGHVQTLGVRTVARVGQAHSEPVGSFSVNLAERLPELGITAIALPGAPGGSLTLDASPTWVMPYGIGGLDYQAPSGLTLTVDGTSVTGQFTEADWMNAVGVTVFVQTGAGVQAVELRVEARPADTAAGLVEKRVAVNTEAFISDTEMLAASRLSGLEPTIREVRAMSLPAGVERAEGGFVFEGAPEPTDLAFGFEVTEVFDTPFGPVRPDATRAPGEVRISVYAVDEEPPVVVEPEPEEPVTPKPPVTVPPTEQPEPPTAKPTDKPTAPVPYFATGRDGDVAEPAAQEEFPYWTLFLGGAGVVALLGAGTIIARRPRKVNAAE